LWSCQSGRESIHFSARYRSFTLSL
jgi:hypothetical protein